MNVKDIIDTIYPEILEIRRDFHRHPEISQYEERTARKVSEFLSAHNIAHVTEVAGHGVVATIQGKKQATGTQRFPVIAIRADMDALPMEELIDIPFKSLNTGVMHSCGHDIHTAVLLGTAKILKSLEEEFSGTIKLFFQPAEETVGGAKYIIEEGYMEDPHVDAVIGLHVNPFLESGSVEFRYGKMNATSSEFEITVEGISCHAAYPNTGIDPLLPACQIVTSFQSILSRNLAATNSGIITVGEFHSGTKTNIIPSFAKLTGTMRALDVQTRDYMSRRMEEVVDFTCKSFGAVSSMFFKDSYPALINDDDIVRILDEVALEHLGKEKISYMQEPSLGSEDFSFFCEVAKSAYFTIGVKKEGVTEPFPLHSPYFDPDEDAMKIGMLMEVEGALRLLRE